MSRESDYLSELFEAVFAGDLARAEAALTFMQGAGSHSEAIRRAKRRARPEPSSVPELADALVLPAPGARPGDFMGSFRKKPGQKAAA